MLLSKHKSVNFSNVTVLLYKIPCRYSECEQNTIKKLVVYFRKDGDAEKPFLPLEAVLENYALSLAEQLGMQKPKRQVEFGEALDPKILDDMRHEQLVQLLELREAAVATKEQNDK